eukprot:gnl/MRDRNA2_/MRDRNA2_100797_c0_seq1.p1 gnl/MRDRNA2_/MRDRNA2_100797_c0~~gnl/MRDRNA2_/MRDRNA2_100797_c0_seq1.p1  ORF type:complete len:270 (+),score=79.95 gnl/MRDRNA2_/MRDRNA2_100797_c0_seq1:59-868(+)
MLRRQLETQRLMWFLVLLGLLCRISIGEEALEGFDEEPSLELLSAEQLKGIHGIFDSNKDGKVSLEEMLKYFYSVRVAMASQDAVSILEDLDANKNGKLELEEHLKRLREDTEGMDEAEKELLGQTEGLEIQKFNLADKNKDGMLTEAELPDLFYPEVNPASLELVTNARIARGDRDGDGKLSSDEVDDEKMDFDNLDKDKDGFLSLEELKHWEAGSFHAEEAMKDLISMADKDKDGHLTDSELQEAAETIKGSDAEMHLSEWIDHEEL